MRIREYPGFPPGLIISVILAVALSARLARAIGSSRTIAAGLIFSVGIIVSATLTPSGDALRHGAVGPGVCDVGRLGLIPIRELTRLTESGLNVLLFIPLGISIGLLHRSSTRNLLVAGAIALPFVIEGIQLVVTPLDRVCQTADVVDNVTGLVIGLAIGVVAGVVARPTTSGD